MAQQRESETPISISGYQYYIQQTNQTMWCNLFDWFGSLQAARTLKKSNLVILCRSIKKWDLTFAGSNILWNMVICSSMIRVLVRVRRPFYACPQNTRTKCSCASEELFYAIYIFRLSGYDQELIEHILCLSTNEVFSKWSGISLRSQFDSALREPRTNRGPTHGWNLPFYILYSHNVHAHNKCPSIIIPYNAGIDFSRQNLTSVDVRFWRLKSIPAL